MPRYIDARCVFACARESIGERRSLRALSIRVQSLSVAMKSALPLRRFVALPLMLVSPSVALTAHAQAVPAAAPMVLDGYRGALPGEPFSQVSVPKYQGGWPLVIRLGQTVRWRSMVSADINAATLRGLLSLESLLSVAPHESFLLYAGVPVSALQIAGGGSRGAGPFVATPIVGDPRLGGRLRVFGYAHQSFSLHLGGELQFDSNWWNQAPTNINDQTMRGTLELLAGGCFVDCPPRKLTGHSLLWGVNFGLQFRPRAVAQPLGGAVGAHEFRTGWAGAYRLRGYVSGNGVFELRVGVEALTSVSLFVRDAYPTLELAFPVAVVLSQDVDLSIVPSTTSPNSGWLSGAAWGYAVTARLSYALHDRVLDRATERRTIRPLPGGRQPLHEEQDTDRDGRADSDDPCPNDRLDLCVTAEPVQRAYEPIVASLAAVRRERNALLVDGVTTLAAPLVLSQRVDPSRTDGLRSDAGYIFDDRVAARALREELSQLQSSGEAIVALWLRVELDEPDSAPMLRQWAFASIVRALRREGLDASIVLAPAAGFPLDRPVLTPRERFSLVLVARRDSSRDRRPASEWMPPPAQPQVGNAELPRPLLSEREEQRPPLSQPPPALQPHFADYERAR